MNRTFTLIYLRDSGPKVLFIYQPNLFKETEQYKEIKKITITQAKKYLCEEHINCINEHYKNYPDEEILLYGVNEFILTDDTIETIKLKYINSIKQLPQIKSFGEIINNVKTVSMQELYTFGLYNKEFDFIKLFEDITDKGTKNVCKENLYRILQNILHIENDILTHSLIVNESSSFSDLMKLLKDYPDVFIRNSVKTDSSTSSKSSKDTSHSELGVIHKQKYNYSIVEKKVIGINYYNVDKNIYANPYDTFDIFKDLNTISSTQITTTNNKVLGEFTNEMLFDTIYFVHAQDIYEHLEKQSLLQPYISKLYYPHLHKIDINNSSDIDTHKDILIKSTQKRITDTENERNIMYLVNNNKFIKNSQKSKSDVSGDSFTYDLQSYMNSKTNVKLENLKYTKFDFKFYQKHKYNVPIDIFFKLISCSKNVPLIQMNPGKNKQQLFKFYTEKINEDGESIPFLSRSFIINIKNNIPKIKSTSLFIQDIYDYPGTTRSSSHIADNCSALITLLSNGEIIVSIESSNNIQIKSLENALYNQLTFLMDNVINTLYETGIYYSIPSNMNNVEIINIDFEMNISIKDKFNDTLLEKNMYPIISLQEKKLNKKTQQYNFIYKRISNFDNMSAIDAFITFNVNNGLTRNKIIKQIENNFGLSHEKAIDTYGTWLENAIVEANAYNNRKLKVKNNPGISCLLEKIEDTSSYIYNLKVTNITQIFYVEQLCKYISLLFYVSSNSITDDDSLSKLYKQTLKEKTIQISKSSKSSKSSKPKSSSDKPKPTFNILFDDIEIKAKQAPIIKDQADIDNIDIDDAEIGSEDVMDDDLLDILGYDDDDYEDSDEDADEDADEDSDESEDKSKIQSGGTITDDAKKIIGKSLHNPNILSQRLYKKDSILYLKKGKGGFNSYSRLCPSNVGRQPVILTDAEKEKIDKEYPGSYTKALTYGSTEDKKHHYICPRFWCLATNTSMTEDDVKAGKCGGSSKIIPKDAQYVPEDAFILEANGGPKEHFDKHGNYIHHYPGFTKDKSHPDGLCVPCCFKEYGIEKPVVLDKNRNRTIEGQPKQVKRRTQCGDYGPEELSGKKEFLDMLPEPKNKSKSKLKIQKSELKELELREKNKYNIDTTYIKDIEKFPLDINRIGMLPITIQEIFRIDNFKCQISRDNKSLKSDTNCFLRKGIENSLHKSFICVCADLFLGDKEHEYIEKSRNKHLVNMLSNKDITIDNIIHNGLSYGDMVEIIIASFSLDDYVKFNNGNLMRTFASIEYSKNVKIDDYSSTQLYKSLIKNGKKSKNKTKNEIEVSHENYLREIIGSYLNFCNYLRDPTTYVNYEYLWDIVCTPNKLLFPDGLNLVILEQIQQDETTNIQIPCPKLSYSNNLFDKNRPTAVLTKLNNYFEPIYIVNDYRKNITLHKYFYIHMDNINGINQSDTTNKVAVFMKFVEDILTNCKSIPTNPNVYMFNEPLTQFKYINVTRKTRSINTNYYVLNNRNNVIGVNVSITLNDKNYGIIEDNITEFTLDYFDSIDDKSKSKDTKDNKHTLLQNISITPISTKHKEGLLPIVSNIDVMKYIKKGEIWNETKLIEFLKWGSHDMKKEPIKNDSFYWTILNNKNKDIVGVIGIHKWKSIPTKLNKYKDEFYTTRFLNPDYQGKGIGTYVMALALEQFFTLRPDKKMVLSLSLTHNIPSHKSLMKIGFKKSKTTIDIETKEYNIFVNKWSSSKSLIKSFIENTKLQKEISKKSLSDTKKTIKTIFRKGDTITGFIPLAGLFFNTSSSKDNFKYYNKAEYYDLKTTFYFTKLFGLLNNYYTRSKDDYYISHKMNDSGLIVGLITNTDQFIPLNTPYEDLDIGILATLQTMSGTNLYIADDAIKNDKYITKNEITLNRKIYLESNFYNAFRNTFRIIFNDYTFTSLKKTILELINDKNMYYQEKYDTIKNIVTNITNKFVDFVNYDDTTLNDIQYVTNCLLIGDLNDNAFCSSKSNKLVLPTSYDTKTNIKKLLIPKKHLLSGYDNNEIYISRITNELLENSFMRNFILKPQQYLLIRDVPLRLNDDELIMLESELTTSTFNRLKSTVLETNINQITIPFKNPQNAVFSNKINYKKTLGNVVLDYDKQKTHISKLLSSNKSAFEDAEDTEIDDDTVIAKDMKFLKKKKVSKNINILKKLTSKIGTDIDTELDISNKNIYDKDLVSKKCISNIITRIGGTWSKYFTKNTVETKIKGDIACVNNFFVSLINYHLSINKSTELKLTLREIKTRLIKEYNLLFDFLSKSEKATREEMVSNVYNILAHEGKTDFIKKINKGNITLETMIYSLKYQFTNLDIYLLSMAFNIPIIMISNKDVDLLNEWYISKSYIPTHLTTIGSSKKKDIFIPNEYRRIFNMLGNYKNSKFKVDDSKNNLDYFSVYDFTYIIKQTTVSTKSKYPTYSFFSYVDKSDGDDKVDVISSKFYNIDTQMKPIMRELINVSLWRPDITNIIYFSKHIK